MTRADHPTRRAAVDDAQFDAALRRSHEEAVAQVSPRTRLQLQNRLRAAQSPPSRPTMQRPAWGLALGCSLALVAVFGLRTRMSTQDTPAPVAANDRPDNGDLVASLDETPDLYLWLASNDASGLVPE